MRDGTREDHAHVGCRACGATGDVAGAAGHTPCLTPSQTHGALDEAEVVGARTVRPASSPLHATAPTGTPRHHVEESA